MPGEKIPEAERRAQLLEAARDLAVERGLAGVRMADVAKAAGVSKGLVFFHFENKDGLRLALLDRLLAGTVIPYSLPAPAPGQGAKEVVLAFLLEELRQIPERAGDFALFMEYWTIGLHAPAVRERLDRAIEAYRLALEPLARAVIAEEGGRLANVDPRDLSSAALALVEGAVLQAVVRPADFDADRLFDAIVALVE